MAREDDSFSPPHSFAGRYTARRRNARAAAAPPRRPTNSAAPRRCESSEPNVRAELSHKQRKHRSVRRATATAKKATGKRERPPEGFLHEVDEGKSIRRRLADAFDVVGGNAGSSIPDGGDEEEEQQKEKREYSPEQIMMKEIAKVDEALTLFLEVSRCCAAWWMLDSERTHHDALC
jgi:hypothetical protein